MKFIILFIAFTSFAVVADEPKAKLEVVGSNMAITFNDYEKARVFEKYRCMIHIDDWIDSAPAYEITKNGERMYQCLYQGYLQPDTDYLVWISFTEWPEDWVTSSNAFWLRAK